MKPEYYSNELESLIKALKLPDNYFQFIDKYLDPLHKKIIKDFSGEHRPIIIGVNGAQGTGKTTCCQFLQLLFRQSGFTVVTLSIDDFYLSHADRLTLAETVHPLLATRGVPGTHNIQLMQKTIDSLLQGESVKLPAFDKATDDCIDQQDWPLSPENVEIIIIEGWCIGATAEAEEKLQFPINALERDEDKDQRWRKFVNDKLKEYQPLFNKIDHLLMLKAPDITKVVEWRKNQERQLAEAVKEAEETTLETTKIMSEKEVERFVQHYERLTKSMFVNLPPKADTVFYLSDKQRVLKATGLF